MNRFINSFLPFQYYQLQLQLVGKKVATLTYNDIQCKLNTIYLNRFMLLYGIVSLNYTIMSQSIYERVHKSTQLVFPTFNRHLAQV